MDTKTLEKLARWVRQNPNAVAGDHAGEELLEIVRSIRFVSVAQSAVKPDQTEDNWEDDPSADERWNAGLDYGMVQLCSVLGIDPHMVNWDAATETLDGDVCSAICNIFRAKYGEDFDPTASVVPSTHCGGENV